MPSHAGEPKPPPPLGAPDDRSVRGRRAVSSAGSRASYPYGSSCANASSCCDSACAGSLRRRSTSIRTTNAATPVPAISAMRIGTPRPWESSAGATAAVLRVGSTWASGAAGGAGAIGAAGSIGAPTGSEPTAGSAAPGASPSVTEDAAAPDPRDAEEAAERPAGAGAIAAGAAGAGAGGIAAGAGATPGAAAPGAAAIGAAGA